MYVFASVLWAGEMTMPSWESVPEPGTLTSFKTALVLGPLYSTAYTVL